tara:strand:+ start:64350 stop:64649 length:300 start_codon:yes stop_codon:yes gene_type:complete
MNPLHFKESNLNSDSFTQKIKYGAQELNFAPTEKIINKWKVDNDSFKEKIIFNTDHGLPEKIKLYKNGRLIKVDKYEIENDGNSTPECFLLIETKLFIN